MKITASYLGDKRFSGGEGAARVLMDAGTESGGKGEAMTPKQLVLQGLAACTGMDVVSMLEKKEVPFDALQIDVEAAQSKYHPVVFTKIHVTYRATAPEASREAIEKAITLSEKTFCGVSAMLKMTADMTSELVLQPV